MFVTRDGQRLYLTTWSLNVMRVFDELAGIVADAGGRVKPARRAVVTDRSLGSELRECREKYARLVEAERGSDGDNALRHNAIVNLQSRLRYLESLDNAPIEVYGQSWITFVLHGKRYYFSVDDNMFFEHMYSKTPVDGLGRYSADACVDTMSKDWVSDAMFNYNCPKAHLAQCAQNLFDALVDAGDTRIVTETRRRRVYNRRGQGYHYEVVTEKPRIATLDF